MKRILVWSAVLVIPAIVLYQVFHSLSSYISVYLHRRTTGVLIILTLLILVPIAFRLRRILSPSKKQSTLTCLSEGSSFTGEIIFVHGMDGDAEKTWVAANGKSSWAEWLKEDRPDLRIWSFGYPASSSAWVGSAMQLHDRAINFLAHLQSNGLGEKPTCFITHSLGGLVVKQLLHEALVFSPKSHKSIAGKVRGVVFIATPHIGSILAAFVYKLKYLTRPTWVITDLTPSRHLQRLNDWYRDHVAKAKIKTLVFRENEPTHGLATVVNFISADANIPGVTTIAIDSDHINICKPTDKKAPIYSRTLKFLDEVFPRTHKKFHVPHQENQNFTDREEIIARIRSRFGAGEMVQSLNGIGGIGKTETVVRYAYKYRNEYEAVFWAKAQSRESLVSDFVTIAGLLDLREKNAKDQSRAINAVKKWLENNCRWLLILDNADDLTLTSEFSIPNSQGHVLMTTRTQNTGKLASPNKLVKWGPNEGALFLLRRLGLIPANASLDDALDHHRQQAKQLSEVLEGLPLALDQAAAYIIETQSDLAEYCELYEAGSHKLLSKRGEHASDHPESVTRTFTMSFGKVAATNPAAVELLRLCAFLDANTIPEEIFQQGVDVLGESLGQVGINQMELIEAIKDCRRFSLLNRNEDRTVSIHRLVQVVLRDEMGYETQRLWVKRAVCAVNRAFPNVEYATWPFCERLIQHALALARYIDELDMVIPEAARLLNRAGEYLVERARYGEAEPLYRRSLEICEKDFGPEHLNVAGALNNLALFFGSLGKFAEAEPLYQRALDIYKKDLGSKDSLVAVTLNNLAMLYCSMGKYDEAEPLYLRSLEIHGRELGPDDPQTASLLSNLADLYDSMGNYPKAEMLHQRSLAIIEKAFGSEHPDLAITLNNLAGHYHLQKNYLEAETLYKRALALCEKTFGQEHLYVAETLNNLAGLYQSQKKYDAAKPLYERALNIYEKTFGPEHPEVAGILETLAQLYNSSVKIC